MLVKIGGMAQLVTSTSAKVGGLVPAFFTCLFHVVPSVPKGRGGCS